MSKAKIDAYIASKPEWARPILKGIMDCRREESGDAASSHCKSDGGPPVKQEDALQLLTDR